MIEETIQLKSLTLGYQTKGQAYKVAENLDASLFQGELTCLIGANGVGKSTLLRTLAGFQPPLEGKILIKEQRNGLTLKDLHHLPSHELSRLVSVVLTTKPDVTNLTIQEMVGMGRTPYTGFWGTLGTEDKAIVEEAMHKVGISHLASRMIQTLSDGERQKVMIAKALAQQTPVIFLDEPTSFLDFPSKVEILQMLRNLAKELQKTIFLSIHDVELALQLADKLWLMEKRNNEEGKNYGEGRSYEEGRSYGEGRSYLSIGTPKELASNGSLSRFINRDGIKLDPSTLRITIG